MMPIKRHWSKIPKLYRDSRTPEKLSAHYQIEKGLAPQPMNADQGVRMPSTHDSPLTTRQGTLGLSTAASFLRMAVSANAVFALNSAAIVIGNCTNAALGFVFWWLAARSLSAEANGSASALISMMLLVAQLGDFGLATLLLGETQRHPGRAHGLIVAALLTVLALSALFGSVYCVLAGSLSLLGPFSQSSFAGTLFVGGCAITAFASLLDTALIGLLRSTLCMYRNSVFGIVKLLLLAAVVMVFPSMEGVSAVLFSWVGGICISLLLLLPFAWNYRVRVVRAPDFDLLATLNSKVIDHHLLNVSTQAPAIILPYVVAVLLSPEVNAAFYPTWMLITVALIIPSALTTTLFAAAAADPGKLRHHLRFSLVICGACALATGIFLLLFSSFVLRIFNPAYPEIAGSSLNFLGFGLLGVIIKFHYIALMRLRNRMRLASVWLGLAAIFELGMAAAGARIGGLQGLVLGWLLAIFIQAVLMSKPILEAGLGAEQHNGTS
ncbi:lipopolysaccharide biosynthesis protein [Bradyrhizobium sp. AZCC 2289]|uniref:lipopolysaccharide biosynthesis protein n=1 Tax=Bradyrhizobium sp. AZCC 2289 TaxID=3117026 RepID=UPI002FF04E9A